MEGQEGHDAGMKMPPFSLSTFIQSNTVLYSQHIQASNPCWPTVFSGI